jgi:hypothetical protein
VSHLSHYEKKNRKFVSNLVAEPHSVYYRPKITDPSDIIPDEEVHSSIVTSHSNLSLFSLKLFGPSYLINLESTTQ